MGRQSHSFNMQLPILLALIGLMLVCQQARGACESGWTEDNSVCYMALPMSSNRYTFRQARSACLYRQGDLVELTSDADRQFLQNLTSEEKWIGLSDIWSSHGVPRWVASGRSVLEAYNAPLDKKDFFGWTIGQMCAYQRTDGRLYVRGCDRKLRTAICQKTMADCPPCTVAMDRAGKEKLMSKALCQQFAIVGNVTRMTSRYHYLKAKYVCKSTKQVKKHVLGRVWEDVLTKHGLDAMKMLAGTGCIRIPKRVALDLPEIAIMRPAPSAECWAPCGLGLKVGKKYLLSGAVDQGTENLSLGSAGAVAMRWVRYVRKAMRTPRARPSPSACK